MAANRFISTGFFKSPFVRGLDAAMKLLYVFIICDCEGSGIWVMDLEAASIYTKQKISLKDFEANFIKTGKAYDLKNGKFFFPDFIHHQYPSGLNNNNRAHNNFIKELHKYSLIDENLNINEATLKGLRSGIDAAHVMVKVKEEVMVMEKVKVKGAHLFEKSEYFEFVKFDLAFSSDEKYATFNTKYYYEAVKNWSANGNTRKDWIATARNFMLRDMRDGKAVMQNGVAIKSNHKPNKAQSAEQAYKDFENG